MNTKEIIIIVDAVGKKGPFPDTLTKNLAGVPLIQRTINLALKLTSFSEVYVMTDSEEVGLICERNGISISSLVDLIEMFTSLDKEKNIISISPYCPLINDHEILNALQSYEQTDLNLLLPVKRSTRRVTDKEEDHEKYGTFLKFFQEQSVLVTLSDFQIFSSELFKNTMLNISREKTYFFELSNESIEIANPEDWWVCEKLLNRKRIVFRVIGSETIGMGHIYRALSLAHDITDHEVIFVCDEESEIVVKKLTGMEYRYEVFKTKDIIEELINLQPNLVINDILDTDHVDVHRLQQEGIKVVNFEDFGSGATVADLTINEMFDQPVIAGEKILWGREYYFVRDEFFDAKPHQFNENVESVLITFGGTDQNDLTRKILYKIKSYCENRGIKIYVVAGSGYLYYEELRKEFAGVDSSVIEITHATGIISRVMEKTPIAIASNGRTVYELAHMNIPSIIVPVNDREETHAFACEENGFVPLKGFREKETPLEVLEALKKLVDNNRYRKSRYMSTMQFNFSKNKANVLKKIEEFL